MSQIELFDDFKNKDKGKYTRRATAPQYLPSDRQPELSELYSVERYGKFISAINKSNVSDEEKTFLKLAASRHIVFNYSKIADYYAHATPEMQKLMEQSALVIIDLNDAIANGYVQFSELVKNIMIETGEDTKNA